MKAEKIDTVQTPERSETAIERIAVKIEEPVRKKDDVGS